MEQRYFRGRQQENYADIIWRGGIGMMFILLFLFLLAVNINPGSTVLLAVVYGALNIAVFTAVYFLSARCVGDVLCRLGDMIECLIGGKEKILFSIEEDTMLSKLQGQLLKLYDILRSHEENEQKLRRQLDENIGNLVHQLNTPITNIVIYADFMKRDDLTVEEKARFLRCMEEQAGKLSWLGESFSKISRLETGMICLKPGKQQILPLLLDAVDQVMEKARKKGMEIALEGETQAEVAADAKWTTEAVFNVLDNAVKYGDAESKVTIAVTELSSFVCVAVRDRGTRISGSEYHKIFQRFYRGKHAGKEEGAGLGLYIAREILEKERGYIKAETLQSGETEFQLYLPKL